MQTIYIGLRPIKHIQKKKYYLAAAAATAAVLASDPSPYY